ncbi:hypothetical protein VMCG_07762 [Cytospora schulzeri]|uniref:Uncharacterized protein n=1 Tax=Cytospora schulzeri TaxID=448051 RepID=A0A423VZR0_9PEZI|nr:hypothetical protein VMCG_07762 [Valsa malicola]
MWKRLASLLRMLMTTSRLAFDADLAKACDSSLLHLVLQVDLVALLLLLLLLLCLLFLLAAAGLGLLLGLGELGDDVARLPREVLGLGGPHHLQEGQQQPVGEGAGGLLPGVDGEEVQGAVLEVDDRLFGVLVLLLLVAVLHLHLEGRRELLVQRHHLRVAHVRVVVRRGGLLVLVQPVAVEELGEVVVEGLELALGLVHHLVLLFLVRAFFFFIVVVLLVLGISFSFLLLFRIRHADKLNVRAELRYIVLIGIRSGDFFGILHVRVRVEQAPQTLGIFLCCQRVRQQRKRRLGHETREALKHTLGRLPHERRGACHHGEQDLDKKRRDIALVIGLLAEELLVALLQVVQDLNGIRLLVVELQYRNGVEESKSLIGAALVPLGRLGVRQLLQFLQGLDELLLQLVVHVDAAGVDEHDGVAELAKVLRPLDELGKRRGEPLTEYRLRLVAQARDGAAGLGVGELGKLLQGVAAHGSLALCICLGRDDAGQPEQVVPVDEHVVLGAVTVGSEDELLYCLDKLLGVLRFCELQELVDGLAVGSLVEVVSTMLAEKVLHDRGDQVSVLVGGMFDALEGLGSCAMQVSVLFRRLVHQAGREVLREEVVYDVRVSETSLEELLEDHEASELLGLGGRLGEEALVHNTAPELLELVRGVGGLDAGQLDVVGQDQVPYEMQLCRPAALLLLLLLAWHLVRVRLLGACLLLLAAILQDGRQFAELDLGETFREDDRHGNRLWCLRPPSRVELLQGVLRDFLVHLRHGLHDDPGTLRLQPDLLLGQLDQEVQNRVPPRHVVEENLGPHEALDTKELAEVMVLLFLTGDVAHRFGLLHQRVQHKGKGQTPDLGQHDAEAEPGRFPAAGEPSEQSLLEVSVEGGLEDAVAIQQFRYNDIGGLDTLVGILAAQVLVEGALDRAVLVLGEVRLVGEELLLGEGFGSLDGHAVQLLLGQELRGLLLCRLGIAIVGGGVGLDSFFGGLYGIGVLLVVLPLDVASHLVSDVSGLGFFLL